MAPLHAQCTSPHPPQSDHTITQITAIDQVDQLAGPTQCGPITEIEPVYWPDGYEMFVTLDVSGEDGETFLYVTAEELLSYAAFQKKALRELGYLYRSPAVEEGGQRAWLDILAPLMKEPCEPQTDIGVKRGIRSPSRDGHR